MVAPHDPPFGTPSESKVLLECQPSLGIGKYAISVKINRGERWVGVGRHKGEV
jgi:hypothetical protein